MLHILSLEWGPKQGSRAFHAQKQGWSLPLDTALPYQPRGTESLSKKRFDAEGAEHTLKARNSWELYYQAFPAAPICEIFPHICVICENRILLRQTHRLGGLCVSNWIFDL